MPRILVVDDSALIRTKCSRLLGDNGYEVIEAQNGIEALEKYKEFHPDGVLLDIVMPDMHGMAALREIKRIDPVARVAILTAMGQRNMVMDAIKEGAKDFVVKPFSNGRVLDTVKRILGNGFLDAC